MWRVHVKKKKKSETERNFMLTGEEKKRERENDE